MKKKKSGTSKQNNVVIKIKICTKKKGRGKKKEWSKWIKWERKERKKERGACTCVLYLR